MKDNIPYESDLWHRQFSQGLMCLFWCTAGLPPDHPAVRYIRQIDEVISESGAYEAWRDFALRCS